MATAMSQVFLRASAIAAAAAVFATSSVIDGPYELIGQPPSGRHVDASATIAACEEPAEQSLAGSWWHGTRALRHSWLTRVVVASTLLTSILGVTNQLDPLEQGLKGEYFSDLSGASQAVASTLDSQPSTDRLVNAWHGSPPEVFSTTWTGSIVVLREGTCTLATVSDYGSPVFVDGRLVVDNG